ncbi:MAG TPA: hypothetical protein VGI43_17800 [Mucilaginibacter sp.]|jgi:hypothetical protein
MKSPFVRFLLMLNNSYTLFVSSWHMGLMVSVLIFWYPTWIGLTLAGIHENFGVPAQIATEVFIILIPIMFITTTIMIISEWKTPLRWPAICILLGSFGSTIMAKYFLFPLNDQIAAGMPSQAALTEILKKWMGLNDWRVCFSVFTWLSALVFFQMKIKSSQSA